MDSTTSGRVRMVAETAEGYAIATVDLPATRERVFRAISTAEVTNWWVRPGVFDTREFTGEARVGGRWRATGMVRGRPYTLEGEFLAVEPHQELVHTWEPVGAPVPAPATTVAYRLESIDGGTRITVRHSGFTSPDACTGAGIGWETSCERLLEVLNAEGQAART